MADAVIARSQLDYHRAYEIYSAVSEEFPRDPNVGLTRARVLEDTGDTPEAIRQYERLLRSSPSAAALLGLGRSLMTTGWIDAALTVLSDPTHRGLFAGHIEAQGMLHSIVGVGHRHNGRLDLAGIDLQRSLELRSQAGDLRGQATTLTNIAWLAELQGGYREAEALLLGALDTTRQIGDVTIESFALLNLGENFLATGRLHDGLEAVRESIDIELDRNDPLAMGHRMHSMAHIHLLLGNYEDAAVFAKQTQTYATQAEELKLQAKDLTLLGRIQLAQGRVEASRHSFASSDRLSTELGLSVVSAHNQLELSRLHALTGDHGESRRAIEKAIGLTQRLNYEYGDTASRLYLARHWIDTGNVDQASDHLTGSFNENVLTKEHGLELALARAKIDSARGNPTAQLRALRTVAADARECGYFELGLTADVRVAESLMTRQEYQEAKRTLRDVIEASKRARAKWPHAEACLLMAELETLERNFPQSEAWARDAIELAAALEGRPFLVRAHAALALALEAKGDAAEAAQARAESDRLQDWIAQHTLPVHAVAQN